MAKKDYKLISDVIKKHYSDRYADEGAFIIGELARELATAFQSDNPRFDREKFLAACGIS